MIPVYPVRPEHEADLPVFPVQHDLLGYRAPDAPPVPDGDLLSRAAQAHGIAGGGLPGPEGFAAHVVHQVVDVEHVPAGEDPRHVGFQAVGDHGAAGDGRKLHPRADA